MGREIFQKKVILNEELRFWGGNMGLMSDAAEWCWL
jgi:hypothetical protein